MLEKFDPQQGLALSCPKSHPFAPRTKVFALLGLASKAFFQLLNLILFDAEQSIASPTLCIDRLRLVRKHLPLGLHELTHGLAPKVDNHSVKLP